MLLYQLLLVAEYLPLAAGDAIRVKGGGARWGEGVKREDGWRRGVKDEGG